MAKTKASVQVDSDNCFLNGWEPNEYRIRTDKDNQPYIMLLGHKVDITTKVSPIKIRVEDADFNLHSFKGDFNLA